VGKREMCRYERGVPEGWVKDNAMGRVRVGVC